MKSKLLKKQTDKEKILRILLILTAIAINIKYILVDFGIDAEFQITMSYRLAVGDKMFLDMWEPYQMSAFLCALFIKIYLWLFGTTTGIVLYLQLIGVLIDVGLAFFLYHTVKTYLNAEKTAFAMAWLFVLMSPKDIPLADYTNMQMWFSLLLCIFMFMQYKTKKRRFVVLAALSLCGAVLSYPSCLLLLISVLFVFGCCKDYKNALLFTGICVGAGLSYLGIIFLELSPADLIDTLHNILAIETSHAMSVAERFFWYFKDLVKILAVLIIVYGISYGIVRLIVMKKTNDREKIRSVVNIIFILGILIISLYTIICWQEYVRYTYAIVFIGVILSGGMIRCRHISKEKRYFYLCGTVISVTQFAATLLLTNLEFVASLPYLLIAVLAAFLPLGEAFHMIGKEKKIYILKTILVAVSVFVVVFRGLYIIRPMSGDVAPIYKIASIVKAGPAIGIVSEYMGPYMQNETMNEWEQYIEDGQSIYLIGDSLDTLGYLYKDTEVAAPSLVPTPGYNEMILKYWEQHPEKYPDVIIASCWYGDMQPYLEENEWMLQWIEEEYRPAYSIDGKYWRYYFREE